MFYLLIVLLHISGINTTDLNEIISRFEEEKCVEDDFIDPDILAQATDPWLSAVYTKGNFPSKNSLSLIHELAQLNKIDHYYYLEKEEGPAHSKYFYISLTLGKEVYKGNGMGLKEAKRHAAEEALLHTAYIIPEQKGGSTDTELTPTVQLNNVAMKLGMKVTYLSEDELKAELLIYKQKNLTIPDGFKTHLDKLNYTIYHPYETKKLDVPKENQQGKQLKVGVIVGEMKFIGVGYTLQAAKHDAAKNALVALRKISLQEIERCIDEGFICNPDNNKSPVSILYEMAQEKGMTLDFEVVGESGPAHEKVFVTKCQYADLTVEGSGKSKKLSKRSAAEAMLRKLEDVQPSTDNNGEFSIDQISKKKKKKKKKKLIKSRLEKFAIDAKSFVSSTWEYAFPEEQHDDDVKDEGKNKKKKRQDDSEKSNDFKRILLGLVQNNGISAHFVDLGMENSKHYSLLFLGLNPKYVCLGDAQSYDLSRQQASLEAINFFYKLGITDLIPSQEAFQYVKNIDFGKMYIVDGDVLSNDETSKKE